MLHYPAVTAEIRLYLHDKIATLPASLLHLERHLLLGTEEWLVLTEEHLVSIGE